MKNLFDRIRDLKETVASLEKREGKELGAPN